MKNFKTIIYICLLGFFIIGCSSSSEPEIVTPDEPTDGSADSESAAKITYQDNVKTIIDNSCATSNCHDTTNPKAGLRLTNFSQVKEAASSGNLIARMNSSSNPMPIGGRLPSSTRDIIDKWKADGFLEN